MLVYHKSPMTSRYVEIRADNTPADGKISFKNGFPVMSFTISAQDGLLDPRSVRVCGKFQAFKDNLATPTPVVDGDNLTSLLLSVRAFVITLSL